MVSPPASPSSHLVCLCHDERTLMKYMSIFDNLGVYMFSLQRVVLTNAMRPGVISLSCILSCIPCKTIHTNLLVCKNLLSREPVEKSSLVLVSSFPKTSSLTPDPKSSASSHGSS